MPVPWCIQAAISSLIGLSLAASAAQYTVVERPSNLRRAESDPQACLRFPTTPNHPARFIVNFCRQAVFVSVIEIDTASGDRHCAVYGLQGGKYGKQYGPGQMYQQASVQAAFDADRALELCRFSGYAVTGQGLGEFVHFVKQRPD